MLQANLSFFPSPECTEFIEFTKPQLPASYYRKITSREFLIYHSDRSSVTWIICTHLLSPEKKSKVWLSAQLSSDSPSPPALSSSTTLPLRCASFFFPFPPFSSSLLPQFADNVNSPTLTAKFWLFSSFLSPLSVLNCLEVSNQNISSSANERPAEGHPGLFQPRHTTSLPIGWVPKLHKTQAGLQRRVLPLHFPPSHTVGSHTWVQSTLWLITLMSSLIYFMLLV